MTGGPKRAETKNKERGDLIEAVDFPRVGERVVYEDGDGSGKRLAYVQKVASHDGDVDLCETPDVEDWPLAQDVKRGTGPHSYQRIDVP